MYRCRQCNILFDISEEHKTLIRTCTQTNKPERAVTKCPECGQKFVVGGEPDLDPVFGIVIIIFSQDFEEHRDHKLKIFNGVRQER